MTPALGATVLYGDAQDFCGETTITPRAAIVVTTAAQDVTLAADECVVQVLQQDAGWRWEHATYSTIVAAGCWTERP